MFQFVTSHQLKERKTYIKIVNNNYMVKHNRLVITISWMKYKYTYTINKQTYVSITLQQNNNLKYKYICLYACMYAVLGNNNKISN